jgi:Endosomal/lysosomal potassium channel TMEM175
MTTDSRPTTGRDLLSVERLVGLPGQCGGLRPDLAGPAGDGAAAVPGPASAAGLAAQLAKQAGHQVSYVIAFYIIAQFWLVRRRVFRHVVGCRDSLAWWNFAFLTLRSLERRTVTVPARARAADREPRSPRCRPREPGASP